MDLSLGFCDCEGKTYITEPAFLLCSLARASISFSCPVVGGLNLPKVNIAVSPAFS